jgi:hypothetical protein
MIQIPFEAPQKGYYPPILEMPWEFLPSLADGGPLCSFEISEPPKVAWTEIWRVG